VIDIGIELRARRAAGRVDGSNGNHVGGHFPAAIDAAVQKSPINEAGQPVQRLHPPPLPGDEKLNARDSLEFDGRIRVPGVSSEFGPETDGQDIRIGAVTPVGEAFDDEQFPAFPRATSAVSGRDRVRAAVAGSGLLVPGAHRSNRVRADPISVKRLRRTGN